MNQYLKDPDETLDYGVDWSAELGEDTIDSSTWVVPAGLTEESASHTDDSATVWLSGGTAGSVYPVENHIATDGGRTMVQTIYIKVVDK